MGDHLKLSFNLILSTAGNLLTFLSSTPQLPTPNSPLNIKTSIDQAVSRYHASLDQVEIEVTLAERFLISRLEELKSRNALQQAQQQKQQQQQKHQQQQQQQQQQQRQFQVKKESSNDNKGMMFIDNANGLPPQGIKMEKNEVLESTNHNNSNNNINNSSNKKINNKNTNKNANNINNENPIVTGRNNNYTNNNDVQNGGKNHDANQLLEEDTDLNFLLKDADVKFDDPIEIGVVTNKNNNINNHSRININANNANSNFNINASSSTNLGVGNAAAAAASGSLPKPDETPIFIEDEDIESLFNDNFYQA